jgi:transcription termination factor Rho
MLWAGRPSPLSSSRLLRAVWPDPRSSLPPVPMPSSTSRRDALPEHRGRSRSDPRTPQYFTPPAEAPTPGPVSGQPTHAAHTALSLFDVVTVERTGVLHVLPEGFGFLRDPASRGEARADDIYVSPSQVKRFKLQTGDVVHGHVRAPRAGEKLAALLRVEHVGGQSADTAVAGTPAFDTLTSVHPDQRLRLADEGPVSGNATRALIDLVAPLGRGQRGLIVSPPRAGKTTVLRELALALTERYPEMSVLLLLVDERPEEVSDFQACVPGAEVLASTFDGSAAQHVRLAESVLERAKRLVERGRHVVILLDSLTRLARAYNALAPAGGPTLSGGISVGALEAPKRFFGAARQVPGGGSLTILASVLVGTGSRADDLIFEEFKGTGNFELVLDRRLAEKRLFPAVDIARSGTRKDERLYTAEEAAEAARFRRRVGDMSAADGLSWVLSSLRIRSAAVGGPCFG